MFFKRVGKIAIGSRLRMLSDMVTEDAVKLYEMYDVALKPKWFPVFYSVSQHEKGISITSIADEIGHSHPSVIKIVKEMDLAGLILEKKDKNDKRKTLIVLSQKGIALHSKIQVQYKDVNSAMEIILSQMQHNIWQAMEEMEYLLSEKSLYRRVLEQKKIREAEAVSIVAYQPVHKEHFKKINEAWITKYFKIEEADKICLNNPKEYIIDQGGHIFMALYKGEPVGTCALIKVNNEHVDYELTKMAVSPKAQGKGIGWLLGKAIVEKARELNAKNIYLESNTILTPALKLYKKLGFKKIVGNASCYDRCNIQMKLDLD